MYLSNCRLQQVNRTRILDAQGPECREVSPEFGASRAAQKEQKPRKTCTLWLHLVGLAAGIQGSGRWIRNAFPNCTALNHTELPPPLLSRWGQFDARSVTGITPGNNQAGRPDSSAGDRRDDRHSGTVRRGRLQPLLEPHVVVVDVHVDEPPQLALVVQHAGGDPGVVLLQVGDDLP